MKTTVEVSDDLYRRAKAEAALAALDPGGLDVLACDREGFAARLRSEPVSASSWFWSRTIPNTMAVWTLSSRIRNSAACGMASRSSVRRLHRMPRRFE